MRQNWEHSDQSGGALPILATTVLRLHAQNQRREGIQPLTEEVTLSRQGNKLPHGATTSKELANLILWHDRNELPT